MDMQTVAWLDQEDARVTEKVRRHGWMIQAVGGGACHVPGCCEVTEGGVTFAYTVGLHGFGHPELLVFGLAPETISLVLNALGEHIRSGERLVVGTPVAVDGWWQRFVPEFVPNPEEIVFGATRFYGGPVPVLQLTHDDVEGRYPWDPGYAAPGLQPRPGTFRAGG